MMLSDQPADDIDRICDPAAISAHSLIGHGHQALAEVSSLAQQEYLGKINGQVEEVFSGQNVIKAVFNREEVVKNDL